MGMGKVQIGKSKGMAKVVQVLQGKGELLLKDVLLFFLVGKGMVKFVLVLLGKGVKG